MLALGAGIYVLSVTVAVAYFRRSDDRHPANLRYIDQVRQDSSTRPNLLRLVKEIPTDDEAN